MLRMLRLEKVTVHLSSLCYQIISIRKYIFFSTSQPVWWFVGLRCWEMLVRSMF